jgi:hypothetical protein
MPSSTEVGKEIFTAQFTKALVENAGNAGKAYQSVKPDVTYQSAQTLGARTVKQLSLVQGLNINKVLEDIGATPKAVLGAAWESASKSKKTSDKVNVARLLAKIGAWDQNKDIFAGITNNIDTEVIDIVRVRLKKSRKEQPEIIESRADVIDASIVDTTTNTTSK